jgi:1,4-dihydroxy-6-naphthoate synthase
LNFTLGFSPCPNDTFIFDALVHNKIDTHGFTFDVKLEDVQTLNEWALQGILQISKLSYGVLPLVLNKYSVLNSGSALGKGVGPLLISNVELAIRNVEDYAIAIPGENTTAHLLFSLAYPNAKNKVFLRYDEIENFVLQNKGLGVIIHENRFTYEEKGLKKIEDLGDYWETQTNNPIPLGGIVIDKKIDNKIAMQIDSLIKQSIEYAFSNHYDELSSYVKQYAQEMSEQVMKQHIDLYVNNYSLQLGLEGKQAIEKLISVYKQTNNLNIKISSIFV